MRYECKEKLLGRTPNNVPCHSLFPDSAFARVSKNATSWRLTCITSASPTSLTFRGLSPHPGLRANTHVMDVTAYRSLSIKTLQKRQHHASILTSISLKY